ncbi:hypothetical protein BGX23_011097 [Mortierella sp. AD031]|nr:hypothetical protein BGX23_011097 [Mortierella sp. AD031]
MSIPSSKPTVLIAGGGLGGLMLGALLEKASILYIVLSEHGLSNLWLGIEDEFIALGRKSLKFVLEREKKGPLATVDYSSQIDYTGYHSYIASRPVVYDILLRLAPSDKILFGKRVLTITEKDDRVTIQTADDFIYEGDILVGADGAYSAVRQRLYERLKKEGKLPESDQEEPPFTSTCLAGQSKPLDPAEFPEFKGTSHINTLGKGKSYSVPNMHFGFLRVPTAQNTICWTVTHHLDEVSSKAAEEHRFKELQNSEWGPHGAQTMCNEARHFPIKLGGKTLTMGDLYDWTPKEQISKVMLEEKVFQTWHSGRVVMAIHGAVVLANLLYALPSNTAVEIERIFAAYKAERIGPTTEVFKSSRLMSKVSENGYVGALLLFVMRRLPAWIINIATRRMIRIRLTVGFLPKVENKGSIPPRDISGRREGQRGV